jgi:hypothetical protein
MKRLLQIKPDDWVKLVCPELTEINLTDMPADMVSKINTESRMDSVKWVNGKIVVHLEPMGYRHTGLPVKMLRYRSDIWEYTERNGFGFPQIIQAVIFFDRKHDAGVHVLKDTSGGKQTLNYNYTVIRVWELDCRDIISRKLAGLYPLLPLAKWDNDAGAGEVIETSVKAVESVSDPGLCLDLLAVMNLLAEDKFPRDLIARYIRKERIMQSALLYELYGDLLEQQLAEKLEEKLAEKLEEKLGEREKQIAAKMLREGIALDLAAKVTGLPFEKVSELKLQAGV